MYLEYNIFFKNQSKYNGNLNHNIFCISGFPYDIGSGYNHFGKNYLLIMQTISKMITDIIAN